LVINKGLNEIAVAYQELSVTSRADRLLRIFFEEVTGLDFGSMKLDEELKVKLEEMHKIDFLDTSKVRIKNNIRDFARIMRDLIEEVQIPFSIFGVENFSADEIRRAVMEIARELDLEEFKELTNLRWIGIAQGDKSACEFDKPDIDWYLSRALQYAVYIKALSRKGSLYPNEIKDFGLDDCIDSYSPVDSYGKVLPGIAKKYELEEFEGYKETQIPDAVIIIDSSGSMRNPDKETSYAVIGAFAIARNYLEHGSKVGVINFSGRNIQLNLTRDAKTIYENLKIYQGVGTTLWLDELERYMRENDAEDYILITDAGLDNLEEVVEFFSKIKKRLTVIWIKCDVKDYERFQKCYEILKGKLPPSVTFIEIEDERDIPHIVVGKAFSEVYA
jgi:hypothetical protein